MLRNQKGITLVALVITIIVLLILAGVTISMVLGQNGILNQANQAKAENQKATVEEQVQMAVFAETSQFLQNNVVYQANSSSSGADLAECVSDAAKDTDSQLVKSLPEGYSIASVGTYTEGDTTATFVVDVNGTKYDVSFDGVAQSATVELSKNQG